jgi:FkbM family methyltransferase
MGFTHIKNGVEYTFGDLSVSPWLIDNFATWEPETFDVFEKMADINLVAIDIGAWIGTTSVWLSKNFKNVISVEADPVSVKCLNETLLLSDCRNVTVVPSPVASKKQDVFFGPRHSDWNESMSYMKQWSTHPKDIIMSTVTLDELLNINIGPIGFIKCDIEGGEEDIITDLLQYSLDNECPVYLSFHVSWWQNQDISRFRNLFIQFQGNVEDRIRCDGFCSILFKKIVL